MGQPAAKQGMRALMPMTAEWVDRMRAEWGRDYVDDLVRRATKGGEPGLFYAMEAGQVLGTPFPFTHEIAEWQQRAVLFGVKFAGFIRPPEVPSGTD